MPRNTTERLTPLEFEIIASSETGPANVQAVQQRLLRNLAYTTVQTCSTFCTGRRRQNDHLGSRLFLHRRRAAGKSPGRL